MFSGTAQVSYQVSQFFLSVLYLLVRMTVVDKNKAVVCCYPKRRKKKPKMWSKSDILKGIYHEMFIC
jgi:hypothetical protein